MLKVLFAIYCLKDQTKIKTTEWRQFKKKMNSSSDSWVKLFMMQLHQMLYISLYFALFRVKVIYPKVAEVVEQ